MKKVIIIVFCFLIISSISLSAYSKTGHEMFSEIEFVEDGKLLINMTSSEINDAYNTLGRAKFIGWKHHYLNLNKEAKYVGEVIFAKSNRSREPMKIDYSLKETNSKQRSIKYGGSLSGSFESTIKKINGKAKVNAEVKGEVGNVNTNTRVEETSFSAVVMPNYRLVFRVSGEAVVTSGVSKNYFLGITLKKGSWECIDVITQYYELYEEEIKS